ncbi:MAG: hypothetical protein IPG51_19140 [Chloroflexi bacterium]|nr:hypothetical protein [Chloroflexota bacterium]
MDEQNHLARGLALRTGGSAPQALSTRPLVNRAQRASGAYPAQHPTPTDDPSVAAPAARRVLVYFRRKAGEQYNQDA